MDATMHCFLGYWIIPRLEVHAPVFDGGTQTFSGSRERPKQHSPHICMPSKQTNMFGVDSLIARCHNDAKLKCSDLFAISHGLGQGTEDGSVDEHQ